MNSEEISKIGVALTPAKQRNFTLRASRGLRQRLPFLLCLPLLLLHTQAAADRLPELSTAIIQEAINKAAPGDVIKLKEGIYRGDPIEFVRHGEPEKPITLTTAAGAKVYIKGSQLVEQWEAVGSGPIYRHKGWKHYFGEYTERYLEAREKNDQEKLNQYDGRRDRARNQLFIDGLIQREVPHYRELEAGTFYIDRDKETIYLHLPNDASPKGKFIEVSAGELTMLHSQGKNYLHIKNLNFEHLANETQGRTMVRINKSSHIVIDNVRVQWAAGTAITISNGSNLIIRNSVFNHNGQMGLHSSRAVNALVENTETSYNNHHPDKQLVRWEFGGLKVSRSRNFVFDGHIAHDNRGSGIWFDIDNQDAVIKNSIASGNRYGIHYEISYSALIYNNILFNNNVQNRSGNDGSGIYISSSAGCHVFNNITFGNESYGITLGGSIRTDGAGREVVSHSNLVYNNLVAFNQSRGGQGKSFNLGYGRDITDAKNPPKLENSFMPIDINRSDHNLFYVDTGRDFFIGAGSSRPATLEKWQEESGQDLNSIWADPRFSATENLDFRLEPGSPALKAGINLEVFAEKTGETYLIQEEAYNIGLLDPLTNLEPDPLELKTFALWQAFYFPTIEDRRDPAKGGPGGDPDGDGIPNLMEFALGMDPTTPGRKGLPEIVIMSVEAGRDTLHYMGLAFETPSARTGLEFILEGSQNAVNWETIPLGSDNQIREEKAEGTVRIILMDRDPMGTKGAMRFLRLRIEENSFVF